MHRSTDPRKQTPSHKMRRTAEILAKNPKSSMGSAMISAGYSKAQSRNPHQLTKSRTWQEFMSEFLPDESLIALHKDLTEAGRISVQMLPAQMTDRDIEKFFWGVPGAKILRIDDEIVELENGTKLKLGRKVTYLQPEYKIRGDALDKAYKLRGSYAAEKQTNVTMSLSLADLRKISDDEEQRITTQ